MMDMRKFWLFLWLSAVACALFIGLSVGKILAHDNAILQCHDNIEIAHVNKLSEKIDSSNGLLDESYDRNGDGIKDIVAISTVYDEQPKIDETQPGGQFIAHNPNPIFWVVDLDYDGVPDAVYIDLYGEGRCHDIKLYIDLNAPQPDTDGDGPLSKPGKTSARLPWETTWVLWVMLEDEGVIDRAPITEFAEYKDCAARRDFLTKTTSDSRFRYYCSPKKDGRKQL